jgi:hypothetical protein
LNHAIHIAAVTQTRHDTIGRIYYHKKAAEDKTPNDEIRALKRRISAAVYGALIADTRRTATSSTRVGSGGHPGTTLNPVWPACILTADSSEKPLPNPT